MGKNLSKIHKFSQKLEDDTLYLDFRHSAHTNDLAVFVTQNKVVDYKVIENADQLKIMAEEYIGALNTVDASVYQKSHKLFLKLIEPFLKETTKKILISPHSF